MFFQEPLYGLLLLIIPIIVIYSKTRRRSGTIAYSRTSSFQRIGVSWRARLLPLLDALRVIVLVLVILGLMRPQKGLDEIRVTGEGVDIVLAIDVSTSMRAEDFEIDGKRQNRLYVVKEVVEEFIANRPGDRIGIVVFAGVPYTLSPLTWDHDWLIRQLDNVRTGMVEDGTAIGSAIVTALNRLKESDAKSKVVVLLTDGLNNAGDVPPETAAEAAKALGYKIYTIGAGTKGLAPYPVESFGRILYQDVKIDIDDELLESVAEATGGRYFRATDTDSLRSIYAEIDRLERTEIEMPKYMEYEELFRFFVIPAMILLVVEFILRETIFRRLP
jgi:Ca-activated chloride channel family protein